MSNSLSQHLVTAQDKIRCDAAAKRIIGNREILAWILRGCVPEFKNCTIYDIAYQYIEKEPEIGVTAVEPDLSDRFRGEQIAGMNTEDKTMTEGTVYYDIRFSAMAPEPDGREIKLIINIEAQNDDTPGYPLIKRALYYCARMLSAQNGTEFVPPHYEDIKKVYSIWVCTNPSHQPRQAISQYGLRESLLLGQAGVARQDYDLLSVVFLYLSDTFNARSGEMIDLLNTTFSSDIAVEEKKNILQNCYGITMSRELEGEVSLMCNISEGYLRQGLEKGLAQGLNEGRAQGRAEGRAEGIIETTLGAIRSVTETLHVSVEQAMGVLKIPESEREKYRTLLAQE